VKRIIAGDSAALGRDDLCGLMPVKVLLRIAKMKKWQATLVDCKNSGDTAGDKKRVVGYAAVAFTDSVAVAATDINSPGDQKNGAESASPPLLTDGQQGQLLQLARSTITASLKNEDLPKLPDDAEIFKKVLGCFVTLHKRTRLRGCIGNIFPAYPLSEAVQRNALSAAFEDRRFARVTLPEMSDIDIEISVLTEPRNLSFTDGKDLLSKLKPEVHGVVITRGRARSTYLPQVWEMLPDKQQFMTSLCVKGGMDPGAWKDAGTTRVEVYEAFVFGEKKHGLAK